MTLRQKTYFYLTLCVILITDVGASVLKEALEEHLKDTSHDEGVETIKHDKQKGEKVHQTESQVNDNEKTHYSKANDEAHYLKKDHDTKSASDSDDYKGYNSKKDKVEDSESTGYKRGHKKGHHKQGFQNSYHKDESSNKSTFFDDLNDEGDTAAYNSRQNSHDNHGDRSYQGSHNNGQEYVRDNYRGGGYNRRGDTGTKNAGHQDYGKNYYLDDNLNYNKYHDDRNIYNRDKIHGRHEYRPAAHHDPGWDWQRWDESRRWNRPEWERDRGWNRRPDWDRDYGGPGYYDDHGIRHDGGYGYGPNHGYGYGESQTHPVEVPKSAEHVPLARNAPVVAHRKQTITIYEDPRYDGKDKGQLRREEGDYFELEYKPSSQRYASYDDAYYAAPAHDGKESSKINRLVYNYRRQ